MNRFSAAFALSMICVAPAVGQSIDAPLVFEAAQPAPLAGAAAPDAAMAGDSYLLPFAVRNRTSETIQFRRITLRVPDGLEIIDPLLDGVDNDRDGTVDEGDESFSKTDDISIAWRIDEALAAIPPGSTVERAVMVKLPDTSQAGAEVTLSLIAGASSGDVTLRAAQEVPFRLASPTVAIQLDDSSGQQLVFADATPSLRITMTVPSGEVSDFGLATNASPSVSGYGSARVVVGRGIQCDAPPSLTKNGRSMRALINDCRAMREAPLADRFIAVEADVQLSDADPFSDPDLITARRAVRLSATMTRNGQAFGDAVSVESQIVGALLGARLVSVSEKPVDAGDGFSATYRLVNRGDTTAAGLRLRVENDGAVACRSLAASGTRERRDGCKDGLSLPEMQGGSARDLTVSVKFRDDARFDADTAMRLSVEGDSIAQLSLPLARPTLRVPKAPVLSMTTGGDWKTEDGLTSARVGDVGNAVISGRLPEGRYEAGVRILSRVVDAQTGEPIGAVPLRIERFAATETGGAKFESSADNLSTTTEDGWSIVTLPLEQLSVPVDDDAEPGFIAQVTLSLLDVTEIQADRLIELRAELDLFDGKIAGGEDWIEILIVEPSLDVTVHSTDEDRVLNLHETAQVAVLSCNRGKSSADALVLTARLPEMLQPENLEAARVRTLQIERANDNSALFSSEARSAGDAYFDDDTGILRGVMSDKMVLEPDTCLALVFEVRRADTLPTAAVGRVLAAVEPFTGRDGAQARIYPGLDTGRITFDLPSILFGPASEIDASGDQLIAHTLSLEIPESAGPHRVDLSTESSAGLDWTVLRLDESDTPQPWRNGETIAPGKIIRFRLESRGPEKRPLGWTDTTLVRAVAFSGRGAAISATTRMITRRGAAPGGQIDVTKRMALDRDCDGDLNDERIQDSLFEPVKDASIFRVQFRHAGEKSMERIVVRDQVPAGTELRNGAVEVLRAPEPSQETGIAEPEDDDRDVVWTFEGLFEPGAEGEVGYAVKILEQP